MVYGQVQGMALLRKFCCENPHGADVIGAFHVFVAREGRKREQWELRCQPTNDDASARL